MSNTCPKCGAEREGDMYKCGSWVVGGYTYNFLTQRGYYTQSDRCRGRAEAIAEVDAWHTGEPEPRDGMRIIVEPINFGRVEAVLVNCVGAMWIWDSEPYDSIEQIVYFLVGVEDNEYRWREVRP